MRGVARIQSAEAHRVRRWDVVVLGGALPGLVAAVRLGQAGARVLVLEEAAAVAAPALLREPFVLTGADASGMLGSCLRTLGVPLIDQRRFANEDVAVQVVLPDARLDFGRAALCAAELVAWGLAKPEEARRLVRALEEAALAERSALVDPAASGPRGSRLRRRPREADAAPPSHARGWPREASEAGAPVQALLAALTRGLSNLGATQPSPEARARLIGGLLEGAAVLGGKDACLRSMIRRRAGALFAEFRALDRPFELVSVANQPGLSLRDPDEILAGRVLLLNAPLAGLRRTYDGEAPEPFSSPEPTHTRVLRHLRGPEEVLPEGMGARVLCVPPTQSGDSPVVSLRRQPGERAGEIDLVASAVGPADAPPGAMEEWIDRVLARLIPFADGRLSVEPVPSPVWDTDQLLCDPGGAGAWPTPRPAKLSSRPPIHHLDRSCVAGLGFEGDLWLGLHTADAVAADLP